MEWRDLYKKIFGMDPEKLEKQEQRKSRNRHIQFAVYEAPYKDGPSAIVRYTSFSEDGKVMAVQQVSYHDDGQGVMELDNQVCAALKTGLDVTFYTRYPLKEFPKLKWFANQEP